MSDRQPNHEIAKEIHYPTDEENNPRRGNFINKTGKDSNVGTQILKEADEVESGLIVIQGGFDVGGVKCEHVGGTGNGHDE